VTRAPFFVLLTADTHLADGARAICKRRQVPMLAFDALEHVRGVIASVVPTHLVIDERHDEAPAADDVLGAHRSKVRVLSVDDLDSGLAVFDAHARP
jgi:hypothetical protein